MSLGANHVADAAYRMNELLRAGCVDFFAKMIDDYVDDVGARVEVVAPCVFGNQRAAHHTSGVPHEILQHRVLFRRELDGRSSALYFTRVEMQFQICDLERG